MKIIEIFNFWQILQDFMIERRVVVWEACTCRKEVDDIFLGGAL